MQEPAVQTYTPSEAVNALMKADPNIVQVATAELTARYSEAAKKLRNEHLQQTINSLNRTEEDANMYNENISSAVEESMGTSLTERKQYLESLGYGTGE